jgi:gas vesicle protein
LDFFSPLPIKAKVRFLVKIFLMTSDQKFVAGLLLGAVAGVALGLFLASDKGKAVIADVKEGTDNLQDQLHEKMNDFDQAVQQVLKTGKTVVDNFTEQVK